MINEVVDQENRFRAQIGREPIDFYGMMATGVRGYMRFHYLRHIKQRGDPSQGHCDYFLRTAERAIRLWRIKEGANKISVGKDTPLCPGGARVDGPIFGSTRSVVAVLFAKKMVSQSGGNYGLHPSTESAIRGRPDPNWDMIDYLLENRVSLMNSRGTTPEAAMGCVYYSGTLFVTRDREKYRQILIMAETSSNPSSLDSERILV